MSDNESSCSLLSSISNEFLNDLDECIKLERDKEHIMSKVDTIFPHESQEQVTNSLKISTYENDDSTTSEVDENKDLDFHHNLSITASFNCSSTLTVEASSCSELDHLIKSKVEQDEIDNLSSYLNFDCDDPLPTLATRITHLSSHLESYCDGVSPVLISLNDDESDNEERVADFDDEFPPLETRVND